jgi:hypothetical protein
MGIVVVGGTVVVDATVVVGGTGTVVIGATVVVGGAVVVGGTVVVGGAVVVGRVNDGLASYKTGRTDGSAALAAKRKTKKITKMMPVILSEILPIIRVSHFSGLKMWSPSNSSKFVCNLGILLPI